MSKITKEQIFCTIFNFFEAQQPNCWPFWGVLESTATTLFISHYIINPCLYHLILPIFEKTNLNDMQF